MQAVAVEALRRRQQCRHLFGEPRLDRFRLAAGGRFGARRQHGDFIKPRRQQFAERGAFLAPHGDKIGERLVEAGQNRGLGGAAILFTFVFPRFLSIFKGVAIELPLPTRVVIAISEFFRDYGLYALAAIVLCAVALRIYGRTEAGRLRVDGWKLKIPLAGEVIRGIEMSRFSHFTASLFRAGVEMTQTLAVVEKVMGNQVLAGVVRRAREELIAGGGLSVALRKSGEFPPMVLRMVSAGESSGNLDDTLENVSAYYDREVPAIVKKTFAVLEPAMTILLALVVLGAALSFFLALYKMVGSLGAGK